MSLKGFSTGLTGLQSNQLFLEIIGNNLANVNTIGYRADRASFTDIFSQTIRPGAAPGAGLGGINALQVGSGTRTGTIAKIFSQGNLQNTGRTFDLGISGDGFFRLSDGSKTFYSRAGAFGLDSTQTLVDLATGLKVLGTSGQEIQVDSNKILEGQATAEAELAGNLPGKVEGPTAEVLEASDPFATGTAAAIASSGGAGLPAAGDKMAITVDGTTFEVEFVTPPADLDELRDTINTASQTAIGADIASHDGTDLTLTSPTAGESSTVSVANVTGTPVETIAFAETSATGTQDPAAADTELNDLLSNGTDYADGDVIDFTGVDSDGSTVTGTFTYGAGNDGTTVGDLVTALDAAFPGSTVSLDANGKIVMASDEKGDVALSLSLSDSDTATGSTDWTGFEVTSEGKGPDTVTTSFEVFDVNGQAHAVTLDFERLDVNLWKLNASISADEGTVVRGTIDEIAFNDDGTFASVSGDGSLEFQFEGLGSSQTIQLGFGAPGTFEGLTQFGDTETAHVTAQDGFPPGELTSVFIDPDGTINGAYSNGRVASIDQISLAVFTNPGGLLRSGSNLFELSANTGEPNVGIPGEGGRGAIRSGVLEVSNVDTAQEFVNLIIAQRGFQVNSRVITTSDNILQELLTIVR